MAFVDLQGFKIESNIFIVKEIAVLTQNTLFHDVIKSPFPYWNLNCRDKKQMIWLAKNYHGLSWSAGSISMTELRRIIRPILRYISKIYVKGEEKVKWLHDILDCSEISINIINIESFGCEIKLHTNIKREIYSNICNKHSNHFQCALKNVLDLSDWYLKTYLNEKSEINSINDESHNSILI